MDDVCEHCGGNCPNVEDLDQCEDFREDNELYCRYCGGTCPTLSIEDKEDMCQPYKNIWNYYSTQDNTNV